MFNWLKGKKTYFLGALKFLAGAAIAVFIDDPYIKVAGGYVAVDGLTDISTRAGIADKVDEEKLANKVIRWFEKKVGK